MIQQLIVNKKQKISNLYLKSWHGSVFEEDTRSRGLFSYLDRATGDHNESKPNMNSPRPN